MGVAMSPAFFQHRMVFVGKVGGPAAIAVSQVQTPISEHIEELTRSL